TGGRPLMFGLMVEPTKQTTAADLLASWRSAGRDTAAAQAAEKVAELALVAAAHAEEAADEVAIAAVAALEAVDRAQIAANRARAAASRRARRPTSPSPLPRPTGCGPAKMR